MLKKAHSLTFSLKSLELLGILFEAHGKFVGDVSINEDVYKLHVSSTKSREVVGYYSKEKHAWHFKTSPSSQYDESKNKEYSKFFNSMRAFHNSKDISRKAAQTFSIRKVQREL